MYREVYIWRDLGVLQIINRTGAQLQMRRVIELFLLHYARKKRNQQP
jgi:hypothetical protein